MKQSITFRHPTSLYVIANVGNNRNLILGPLVRLGASTITSVIFRLQSFSLGSVPTDQICEQAGAWWFRWGACRAHPPTSQGPHPTTMAAVIKVELNVRECPS